MKKNYFNNKNGGQALLVVVILCMAVFLTIVLGIVNPIITELRISNDLVKSKTGYFMAEASTEDVLYRLKNNISVSNTEVLSLNGYSATTTITTTSSGKTIHTDGNVNNNYRSIETKVTSGVGVAFNYGVQSGVGGFSLMGGSTLNGNLYSNGSIVATNGSTVTGTAVAANLPALAPDQVNNTPKPPTSSITFGNVAATQDFAQSFSLTATSPLNNIGFYIKKVNTPSDITVRIVTDSSGKPSTNVIANGTLSASLITTNYGWATTTFSGDVVLDPDINYWIVLDSGTNSSKYYTIAANSNGYATGQGMVGTYAGSWTATSPSSLDGYFQIYLGGGTSTIGGGTWAGAIKVGGDAWGHTIKGAQVTGNMYCQTGSNNNKACNTSRSDPPSQGLPISDANIQSWKDDASAGATISGNYTVGYAGATLGPAVITGNLTVNGGGTLTIAGTLWVQGNVVVSGGGKIRLAAAYGANSGVLVSDGIMDLTGGSDYSGSGTAGSYPLIITTSNCPVGPSCAGKSAISIGGGAGAVILVAQDGTIDMAGGTSVKSITANEVNISGGGTVTYDSGLANMNFSSGPSGAWNITSWKEVQ
jgi:hypothetical protein